MDTTSPGLSHGSQLSSALLWQRRKAGHVKRRIRTMVIPRDRRFAAVRRRVAAQHLNGAGLEIGALHQPMAVPRRATVRYVDRFGVAELRQHYPELELCDIVEPDIIDDGETLRTVPDASADFVIANHMIEHCEDPIGTLVNISRVLRPGGSLYMAVPDRRFTFDRHRPGTPFAHVARDYVEGPGWSRHRHYEEWAELVSEVAPDEVAQFADELEQTHYSIHFHAWAPSEFLELVTAARTEYGLPLDLEAFERNDNEFILVLRRIPPHAGRGEAAVPVATEPRTPEPA